MQFEQLLHSAPAFLQRMRVVSQYQQVVQAELDRQLAVRFNVLEEFFYPDEQTLSRLFAWLLNPAATHGQGDTFLRLFLQICCVEEALDLQGVQVKTEVCTTHIKNANRRIDIVITGKDWVVGIENKPWAGEQAEQLADYQTHLSNLNKKHAVLVFLAGDNKQPMSLDINHTTCPCRTVPYRAFGGKDCVDWLKQCVGACEAEKVRFFLLEMKNFIERQFRESSDTAVQGDN